MTQKKPPVACRDERKTFLLPPDTLTFLPPHQLGLVKLAMSNFSHVLVCGEQTPLPDWATKIRSLYTCIQAQEVANALDNCCK